ncbi:MAG TPA: nucleotidyltransferase family protein [Syntrophorhabdaceae bacterium]|nr:nucleotidyltransferase family protein [Syntrophorhabdaceae bacterium]HPU29231.1 nucleotidyltransferase family protein [Syntrophorhabdaceae bacterium]
MTQLCAVILASGSSRRLGFNKLLVKIDKKTVIERSIEPFLFPLIDKIFVVVGFEKERVIKAIENYPIEIIENPFYLQGMSASVKAALTYIRDYKGAFFQLGDRPFVDMTLIEEMVHIFQTNDKKIIVPVHNKQKGHPVLIKPELYLTDMEKIEGDVGLREIIDKYRENVVFIDANEGILLGLDTWEDIENLKKRSYEIEKD